MQFLLIACPAFFTSEILHFNISFSFLELISNIFITACKSNGGFLIGWFIFGREQLWNFHYASLRYTVWKIFPPATRYLKAYLFNYFEHILSISMLFSFTSVLYVPKIDSLILLRYRVYFSSSYTFIFRSIIFLHAKLYFLQTVVYVPNHTSFIDILVMSGFVPRPFKYLSKVSDFVLTNVL